MSEGPEDTLDRHAPRNLSIFENVFGIVKINELMAKCLPEYDPDDRGKENTDGRNHPAIRQNQSALSGLNSEKSVSTSARRRP